jgi:hypothetical protein
MNSNLTRFSSKRGENKNVVNEYKNLTEDEVAKTVIEVKDRINRN